MKMLNARPRINIFVKTCGSAMWTLWKQHCKINQCAAYARIMRIHSGECQLCIVKIMIMIIS